MLPAVHFFQFFIFPQKIGPNSDNSKTCCEYVSIIICVHLTLIRLFFFYTGWICFVFKAIVP